MAAVIARLRSDCLPVLQPLPAGDNGLNNTASRVSTRGIRAAVLASSLRRFTPRSSPPPCRPRRTPRRTPGGPARGNNAWDLPETGKGGGNQKIDGAGGLAPGAMAAAPTGSLHGQQRSGV